MTRLGTNTFTNFIKQNGLILIIALAFVIRMAFFVSLQPWQDEVVKSEIIVKDARMYHHLALSLIENKSFEDFNGFRNPGYPLFLAIIYSFSSGSVWLALLFQILLSLVSVIMVYKITKMFFSEKIALCAALLFAIDILQAMYCVSIMTDSLFVLLLLISVYFLCKSIKTKQLTPLFISALIMGTATLVRPVSYLLPVVVILFILLAVGEKIKLKLAHCFLFAAVFAISLSPWLIHNYSNSGKAGLTSQSGSNLLFCNVAATEAYKTGKSVEEVQKEFMEISVKQGAETKDYFTFKNSDIYFKIARNYIRENFLLYCNRHLMGIVNMYAGIETKHITSILTLPSNDLTVEQEEGPNIFSRISDFFRSKTASEIIIALVVSFYLIISYLFALYAMFFLIRRKENIVYLFILIILYFSFVTGVIGCVRLKLPVMPFINILCAVGLFHFYEKIRTRFEQKQ